MVLVIFMRNILTLMQDCDTFINYINDHYDALKWKYFNFCKEKHLEFDPDIFQDTILKCYDTIKKKGKMNDTSNHGIESYFFLAFRNNTRLEKVYSRNKKRDRNINSDNINDLYELYYNDNNITPKQKLVKDLFCDFACLYIMLQVEQNFDSEHFYLFKLKALTKGMTFKKLQETTNIKSSRKKVLDVFHWIKENITKEDIRKVFNEVYVDLI